MTDSIYHEMITLLRNKTSHLARLTYNEVHDVIARMEEEGYAFVKKAEAAVAPVAAKVEAAAPVVADVAAKVETAAPVVLPAIAPAVADVAAKVEAVAPAVGAIASLVAPAL